jgi:regulator of protease activity HflC (stomatin/prohibitin superfamily)
VVPALAALAGCAAWGFHAWPPSAAPDPALATALGAVVALLAFPTLVAERFAATIPPAVLPEAAALRRLLGVPLLMLPLAGGLEALRGQGLAWPGAVALLAAAGLVLIAAELALRGLARWVQPPIDPVQQRAANASLLLDISVWSLGDPGEPLRTHFGLDFSRSFALSFLRRAALPATILSLLAAWGLSGIVLLPPDGRGVYERFGDPVAVLPPGLHATLPWPLGRVRPLAFGTVREVMLAPGVALAASPLVAADAPAPADADRLWEQPHPGDADWLIAGGGAAGQSFQVMSADIRVLYRIGMTDADARHALYRVSDPDALVRALAARTISRFFAARTLDSVLDQRREAMAAELQAGLAGELAQAGSGLEVVSVTVEAVHPPAAAAAAYHAVQAAEIIANTSVATETGRAKGTASLAGERSWDLLDRAKAAAAETVSSAKGDSQRFTGDVAANQAGGRAFLLERYLQTVSAEFAKAPLTLVDHRLAPGMAPVIDLRPFAAAAKATGDDPD